MFNPDFYPTPPDVAATMLDPLDLRGRVVVEPSAGSGNLRHPPQLGPRGGQWPDVDASEWCGEWCSREVM